jgi:hypothetical protein
MKYKKLYKEITEKYENLEYDSKNKNSEIARLEGQLLGIHESLKRLEGRESFITQENEWLKETLRLVVVPKGKEVELAKSIAEENKKRSYVI